MNIDQEFLTAVENDQIPLVKELLNRGVNINYQDQSGNTALLYAINNNNQEMVKILLTHGANPNLEDQRGVTPLILATSENATSIVQELLNHGANPNQQDKWEETPLYFAARNGNLDMLETLLNHGANPDLTPLFKKFIFNPMFREKAITQKTIQLLHRFYPPVNLALTNPEGVTNLMILSSNPEKTATLEELNPEEVQSIVNRQDNQGNTALIYAVNHNPNPTLIRYLIRNGADPLIKNNEGYSAFDYARDLGERNIINIMMLYSSPGKIAPLEKLKPEEIQSIINQQDNQGNTPLIYAVINNPNPEEIKFLLEHGANPLIKNNKGHSALDYARDLRSKNDVKLIEEYL